MATSLAADSRLPPQDFPEGQLGSIQTGLYKLSAARTQMGTTLDTDDPSLESNRKQCALVIATFDSDKACLELI